MELKSFPYAFGESSSEFKLYLYGIEIYLVAYVTENSVGSNCTFMELKFFNLNQLTCASQVQIVPLWNWNRVIKSKDFSI